MKLYKPHPAAEILPMMPEAEIAELAADIKANGQHHPAVVMEDGRMLDGRNRQAACVLIGAELKVQKWAGEREGASPTAYVLSVNNNRRHLTDSQRAMAAYDALKLLEAEAKARQKAAGGDRRSVSAPGREAVLVWKELGEDACGGLGKSGTRFVVRTGVGGSRGFWASTTDGESWKLGPFKLRLDAREACETEESARLLLLASLKPAGGQKVKGKASAVAAKALGVGARSIERAKALVARAPAEEIAKIRAGSKTLKQVERETKRAEQVKQIRAYVPPEGEFPVITSDPPWKFDDELDGSDGARGGCPYPPMTLDEICALKVPSAKDCVLWLWITNVHLTAGWHVPVLKAWGFTGKTIWTWNKVNIGAGRTLRNVTEHVIVAVRGKPIVLGESTPTLSPPWARSSVHSEKPAQFYKMVEEICPAPQRLEMFARDPRKGWVTTGAELTAPIPPPVKHTDPPVERELPPPLPPDPPKVRRRKFVIGEKEGLA